MTSKEKSTTGMRLVIRSGGFALTLPVAIVLMILLALLNVSMGTIIFGTIFDIGGVQAVIMPVLFFVVAVFALGMLTFFGLIAAMIRYLGGIHHLWQRLRGIREEQERIDRLMSNANNTQNEGDSSEIYPDTEANQKQQYQ